MSGKALPFRKAIKYSRRLRLLIKAELFCNSLASVSAASIGILSRDAAPRNRRPSRFRGFRPWAVGLGISDWFPLRLRNDHLSITIIDAPSRLPECVFTIRHSEKDNCERR